MGGTLKRLILKISFVVDVLILPLVILSALTLKIARKIGIANLKYSRSMLNAIGIFPIRKHYYEPLLDRKSLRHSLSDDRNLPGFSLNVTEQLNILQKYDFRHELIEIANDKQPGLKFNYHNANFGGADADYLYNIIRFFKPKNIIEIGGGNSTLMIINALNSNMKESSSYSSNHICIEPYEMAWLEETNVNVIRNVVENVPIVDFTILEENDLLFIDSSHIIRPQGDVLYEYLEILPSLNRGVIVHIHDIFTPKDYRDEWIFDEGRLWNEQYLLEAFLTNNKEWKVIGALNFLKHNHFEDLKKYCPSLTENGEPGSFYIQKIA